MEDEGLKDRTEVRKFDFLSGLYLNLIREITISRFKLSEQGSLMGFAWTLAYPLLSTALFYVLFAGNIGSGISHFGAYAFSGIITWNLFSNATNRGLGSIVFMRDILRNANIPYEVPPISEVLVRFIAFILEIFALMGIMAATGTGFGVEIIALPALLVLEFLLILGISMLLAVLNVFISDINHIWSLVLTMVFFTTPVFYNVEKIIPKDKMWLYALNPLANIMVAIRDVTIFHRWPDMPAMAYTLVFCTVFLVASFKLLKATESMMSEEL